MTTASATAADVVRARDCSRVGGVCLRHWIYAVLLTIGWHGVWWVWLQPAPPPPRATLAAAPQLSYLPSREVARVPGTAVPDVRDFWSPAVFSLPTPAGFSGTALTNEVGARPPVNMAYTRLPMLERTAVPETGVVVAAGIDALSLASETLTNLSWPQLPAAVFSPPASTNVKMGIEILGGLRGFELERNDLPQDPAVFGAEAWDAMAIVEVSSKGRVLHVFLEDSPDIPAINTWIVRTLMGWRFEITGDTVQGRVRLTWPGRPAAVARERVGVPAS